MPFLFSIIYRLFSSGKINKNSENNFALSAYKTRHIDVLFGKPIQPGFLRLERPPEVQVYLS